VIRFSEGRLSYLAHQIVTVLRQEGLAEIESDRHVLMEIKRALDGHAWQPRMGRALSALSGRRAPQTKNLTRSG
jgi:hypothetical protein